MNRISAIALLAIANLAMAGTALAQSNSVEAKVPFDFTVGDKVLPAGTYTIKPASASLILISTADHRTASFTLVSEDSGSSPDGGKLVFHRYGDQYFLSKILCDNADLHVAIPASKREKATEHEQARNKTNGTTLVAAW
jgi:hypothetical protein